MPNKILVEIIDQSGIKAKKKCVVQGNTVIIRKKKGRGRGVKPEIHAKFDESCLLFYKGMWPFRFLKRKLQLIDGSSKCVSWDIDAKTVDISRYEIASDLEAEVLTKAKHLKTSIDVPFMLYLLLIFILLMNLVSILVSTGRLRI